MTWFSVWEKRARRKAVATVTWLDPVQQPKAQNTESVSLKNVFLMYNKGERTRAGVSLSSEYPPQHYHGIRTMRVKKLCQKMRTLLLLSCAYVSCPQNGNSQIHSVAEHPAMFISGQI